MTVMMMSHPACAAHETPPGHPEQVARLRTALEAAAGLDVTRTDAPLAADADLLRAHPQAYLDHLRASEPQDGVAQLDPDTWMSPGSCEAAWRSAGGAIRAVDAVMRGEAGAAFSACRPPGHHAERSTAMGFCLLGNVAIAAKYALAQYGLSRVAIVDFDVHHGNGTQDLVQDDPRILFVSSHQMPLYPETGDPSETGADHNVLNMALAAGSGGDEMRGTYTALAFPALEAFAPELVLISAGFDAHADDPLAGLNWTEADFAWLTHRLCDLADRFCGGRVVSVLEGGYDLPALGRSIRTHLETLIERHG